MNGSYSNLFLQRLHFKFCVARTKVWFPEATFSLCPPGPGPPGARALSSPFGLLVSHFFFFKGLFYVYENLACTEGTRELGSAGVIDDCEPLLQGGGGARVL